MTLKATHLIDEYVLQLALPPTTYESVKVSKHKAQAPVITRNASAVAWTLADLCRKKKSASPLRLRLTDSDLRRQISVHFTITHTCA